MHKIYTGVGSREIPNEIFNRFIEIAAKLATSGYILRSGGADGSDSAFELGCDSVSGKKEIYLPWPNFNGNTSKLCRVSQEAKDIAAKIHPVYGHLSRPVKLLHGRNVYQVLGDTLNKPSDFLLCYTKNGEVVGGTATAIKLALMNNIPVYNFGKQSDMDNFYANIHV